MLTHLTTSPDVNKYGRPIKINRVDVNKQFLKRVA